MYGLWLPLLNCYRRDLFETDQRVYMLSRGQFNGQLLEIESAGIGHLQTVPDIETFAFNEHIKGRISYFVLDSLEAYFFSRGRFCVRPAAMDPNVLQPLGAFGAKYLFHPVDTPDVLIIDRAPGEEGHGANTRRISNVEELAGAVEAQGLSVEVTCFEGKTMSEQLSLFRSAKIVIAQHGSVLGHIIWMRPGESGVIEIVPKQFRREGWEYFSLIADAMDIPRVEVLQPGPFAPAPIPDIVQALQQLQNLLH